MKILCFFLFLFSSLTILAQENQNDDALYIKRIYNHSLSNAKCYQWLDTLSSQIGSRLAGSEGNYRAVDYTANILRNMNIDRVQKQECMVTHWERGLIEEAYIVNSKDKSKMTSLNAISLGNTVGTGSDGVQAELLEVFSLDTLDLLGEAQIKNKIVFFNRPMDPMQIHTGHAYGKAVDQRVTGATKAGKYGAKAVLVRSVTTSQDDVPHTGVCYYGGDFKGIPAFGVSTNDADMLSNMMKEKKVEVFLKNECKMYSDTLSYNVIGEIKGSEFPDEIILVGGHLDSWDVGGGAHDDGAGCVHALQVFQTLVDLDYKPKRTLRCVMFNNEENGLGGGLAYAEKSNEKGEFHLAAIESDAGGFTPRGFSCTAEESVFTNYFKAFHGFSDVLSAYDLHLKKGGGGADIGPLKSQGGLLIGLRPDGARYFDFHHTEQDVIDNVHKRELELGAAAMTSLVYLIDQYGLGNE